MNVNIKNLIILMIWKIIKGNHVKFIYFLFMKLLFFTKDENEESEGSSSEEDDDEEEKFILTGLAEKKCGWLFYKERLLMLSADHPRLIYYDN